MYKDRKIPIFIGTLKLRQMMLSYIVPGIINNRLSYELLSIDHPNFTQRGDRWIDR